MKFRTTLLIIIFLSSYSFLALSQTETDTVPPVYDYSVTKEYEIGGLEIVGANYSDENAIKTYSGLRVGDKITIPGQEIPAALKALWGLRLFTDVQIIQQKTIGDIIFLEIRVEERPRLVRHFYEGVKKSLHDDLNEDVNRFLLKGGIVTENIKVNAANAIKDFFRGKGYLDVEVNVEEIPEEVIKNGVRLKFEVDKNERVKVKDIIFEGNEEFPDGKLRKKMKNTKRKRKIFSKSRLITPDYEEDKRSLVAFYNNKGFRDARILEDSIWRGEDGDLLIKLDIKEGNQYYFRNISWKGNSIYSDKILNRVLGIKKGDIYSSELLETQLRFSMDGGDVSTLYMDDGYLFFNVDPVEIAVAEDSIDLEIRIFEGPQATIDRVIITGNDRTHEHVIRRELRTRPGEKFSRSQIIRSQREIINLGYFNPESLGINTPVNQQRGTVDIEYVVEEKPADQLELSAGWGGRGRGVIGTLGLSFNNFSIRNIFNKEAWSPLPQGDGQRLSLRAQTNGRFFQSYNMSFTEPWLGGKKPTSFTVAGFYSRFTNGLSREESNFRKLGIAGFSLGIGTRLKFPDDNFVSNTTLSVQNIALRNWATGGFFTEDGLPVTQGEYNNISIRQTIARNTVVDPIFPKRGSLVSLTVQLTPPYSLFRGDQNYDDLTAQERFRWLEYHKWRFDVDWYKQIVGNLVLKISGRIGILGAYNESIGLSPFEQFQLGGDGLSNQQVGLTGLDIISLRGYDVDEINRGAAAPVFDKFTVELRYPLSLNPSATIYVLAFGQGGNAWNNLSDFNPFDVQRSAGMGVRVFLPMFGILGFDYGIGFDKTNVPENATWTDYGRFNIILGFEPE